MVRKKHTGTLLPQVANGLSKFRDECVNLAYGFAKDGLTNGEIMVKFGITKPTFYQWKKAHIIFDNALQRGRDDRQVKAGEITLLEAATGFEYNEVHEEAIVIGRGEDEELFVLRKVAREKGQPAYEELVAGVKRKIIRKRVLPNATLLMFLLTNLAPERWKQVQRQIITGKMKHELTDENRPIDLTKLSKDEIRILIDAARQEAERPDATGTGRCIVGSESIGLYAPPVEVS